VKRKILKIKIKIKILIYYKENILFYYKVGVGNGSVQDKN